MFNLIVVGSDIEASRGSLNLPRDRVFQHTDEGLKAHFAPGGTLDIAAIMKLPCIFANETNTDPDSQSLARLGRITNIRLSGSQYTVDYIVDEAIPPINNRTLETLSPQLHFILKPSRGFGDFQTVHWAVKDADLYKELYIIGLGIIKPKVFKLPNAPVNPKLVSVMMPFDASFDATYAALQAASTQAGMSCIRADDIWNEDVIIQDVVNLISTAAVVICDLSNKNANVFYEAGIAHALGRPFILLARHDSDIPFDLRHIRHFKYQTNEQGLAEMSAKLAAKLLTIAA